MSKIQQNRNKIGVGEVLCFVVLCILAILIIYPLCWILMSSFKDYQGIYGDVWGLPKKWLWENYVTAWNKGISQYFANSLIVTIATLAGVVFVLLLQHSAYVRLRERLEILYFYSVCADSFFPHRYVCFRCLCC